PGTRSWKSSSERPIRERNALRATGGGRVTELLARPIINLLWPELAGIVQPLSGEYAGRRETLEQVPFFSGYGVELGLLVDVAARFGGDVIAPGHLDRRVHRNQDMQALGRMSSAILQAAFLRLAEEGRSAPGNFATTLVQFSNELYEYRPEPREIVTSRRPPIVTVDDYRRRRGGPGRASEDARGPPALLSSDGDGPRVGRDGSLLADLDGRPTLAAAEALVAAHRAGLEVVLVSGRTAGQLRETGRVAGTR